MTALCRSSARLASMEKSMKARTKCNASSRPRVSNSRSTSSTSTSPRCWSTETDRTRSILSKSESPPYVRITSPSKFPRYRTSTFWVTVCFEDCMASTEFADGIDDTSKAEALIKGLYVFLCNTSQAGHRLPSNPSTKSLFASQNLSTVEI